MSRDKTASHQKISTAAKKEFLTYGYQDASMRRIAANAGITVSGLYKHFAGKEEMFASLVEPVLREFMESYRREEQNDYLRLDSERASDPWAGSDETERIMRFIYAHLDEIRLIVCRSRGTKYENFPHEIAVIEEESSLRFIDAMREKGFRVREFRREEFHLLVTANVEAVLEVIRHDLTEEQALHYARTLDDFFSCGWRSFFGIGTGPAEEG